MFPGCCPLVFFLLLTADNVPAVTPSQHEGEGRKFTLAPTTCFHEHVSPIPPIVRRLTLPPASWYAAWWQDLHRGILWNLCKLALMLKCVCVCVKMFWFERNKSFFSLSSRIYLKQSKDQGLFVRPPSFTWCFNCTPHEILRMNENGGMGLSLPFECFSGSDFFV